MVGLVMEQVSVVQKSDATKTTMAALHIHEATGYSPELVSAMYTKYGRHAGGLVVCCSHTHNSTEQFC
jgi:hypothetical protein